MKIAWIKDNKPEIYEKTHKFVSAKDYINFKFCGELAIDPTEASGSCLMDAKTNNWSQEILDLLHIDRHKLPDIKSSSEIIGKIHKNAAKLTGLKEGTPVVCGAGDMLCGLLGAGLTKKDLLMDLTGTGSIIAYYDDNPLINNKTANVRHVLKGWTPYNSLDSSGGALRWFSDTCCKKEKELAELEKKDLFSYLGSKAAMTSAGADGMIFFPYLQGERTMGSSYSKGTFIGMTPATTNAHMVRAIMEGVAFEHKRTIELFSSKEIKFTKLIHTGGAAKSIIWSQIKADIYELPLEISQTEECTAWGVAILAAVGVGLYSDIAQAVENTYQNGCVLVPNTQNSNRYREMFELYTNIHDILQQPFEKLAKII